jgi:competence protein ComEC
MLTLAFSTAAVQLALRPNDAYSISFHLSTAASIGLAAGLSRYPPGERRLQLVDLVAVASIAQLATLPFIASAFGEIPVLSIVANIVAVPLASFAFTLSLAGAAFLWLSASLGEALLIPATWAAEGVLGVANRYGQEWSVISLASVGPFWFTAGLIAAFLILLRVGGDLSLVGRQFRMERGKMGSRG